MSAAKKIIDKKILSELVPLNTLSKSRFEEISEKISITEILAGHYLFRAGERDNRVVYLLGGEVSLLDENLGLAGTIIGGSGQSQSPIANAQPRVLTARAAKKCIVARIDASLLEAFLSWDQSDDAEAVSIGAADNDDWMTRMLQSQAFEKIPPAKIQKLLLKMDAVDYAAGTTVIRQGDAGDYFYTIQCGKCSVTRKKTPQAKEQLLAELSGGDCFGEEALVSSDKRNATVTMLTDGVLMRLAKKDFDELLKTPLIRFTDYEKAAVMVEEGAVWLDVRREKDYAVNALRDSVNIPLATIRGEIPELIFNVSYILCCQDGMDSEKAAFILSHKGFDVYVLEGGLESLPVDAFEDAPPVAPVKPAAAVETDAAAPVAGAPPVRDNKDIILLEEQIAGLESAKQELESDLAGAQGKLATLERVVEEQKKLHEQDRSHIARSSDEHRIGSDTLRERAERLEGRNEELQKQLEVLKADKQAAASELESRASEWVSQRAFFKSESEEAHQRIADLRTQLERATELHEERLSDLQQELESLKSTTSKKIENRDFQCAELKQGQSRMQDELEILRAERDDLQNKLETGSTDAADALLQIDRLKAQLAESVVHADEELKAHMIRLEDAKLQRDEAKKQSVDSLARAEKIQAEVDSAQQEREELVRKLSAAEKAAAGHKQEYEELTAQLESKAASSDKQLEALQVQLDELSQQREDARQQVIERDASVAALQEEFDKVRAAAEVREKEVLVLGKTRDDLQQALEDSEAREKKAGVELESLQKEREGLLARDNGSEQELQAQLERLRKKLEQTTSELRDVREAEQSDIDSLREELREERSARAEERSEMAARQRELKEQLAAVAAEHEEKLAVQQGVIDEARKQQALQSRQEFEGVIGALQEELKQAQKEAAELRNAGKNRRAEDQAMSGEQQQQYEVTIEKLQMKIEKLDQELQAAHASPKPPAGNDAPGVQVAEDAVALQGALEKALDRVEVAERLRAEAEAACERIKVEKETLQKKVSNNISLGNPLTQSSTEQAADSNGPATFNTQSGKEEQSALTQWRARAAAPGKRLRAGAHPVSGKGYRTWLAFGLAAIVLVGLLIGVKQVIELPVVPGMSSQRAQANEGGKQGSPGQPAVLATQAPLDNAQPPAIAAAVPEPAQPQAAVEPVVAQIAQARSVPAARTPGAAVPFAAPPPPRPQALGTIQDKLKNGGAGPLMVKLPAATFLMGSRGNSLNIDEGPQHEVSLASFAISRYEVTFEEYDRFARANGMRLPHDRTWGRGKRPAIKVSWKEAQAYVEWLSKETGQRYVLPSEAQWEFAARAASTYSFPWESGQRGVPANCFDCGSEWDKAMTAPVGSFAANHFGLHDMGGNVQEWTGDCYRSGYDGAPVDGSPLAVEDCTQRAVRGGAFTSPLKALRITRRGQYDQDTRLDNLGFRVVRMQ